MPLEAEELVEPMARRFIEEQEKLTSFQYMVVGAGPKIRSAPYAVTVPPATLASRQRMSRLNNDLLDFYRKKFSGIYLAGAKSIDPTFIPTSHDQAVISRAALDQYTKLRPTIENVPIETRRFVNMVRNDSADRRAALGIKYNYIDTSPESTIRLRGIKPFTAGGKGGKKYTLGDYGKMHMRTGASRLYNHGAVAGAKQHTLKNPTKPILFFHVHDGAGCGWSYHNDPTTADGLVVTIEEAGRYPTAHPNCQRSFSPATKKEEKKEQERRHAMTVAKEKSLAKAALIGFGATFAAAEATNLIALVQPALGRIAASTAYANVLKKIQLRAFQGNVTAQFWVRRLNRLQAIMGNEMQQLATVYRGVTEAGQAIGLQGARDFALNVRTKFFSSLYPGGSNIVKSLPQIWEDFRVFADGFIDNLERDISSVVKRAVGAGERATVYQLGNRFQTMYFTAKKAAMSEDTAENVARVIAIEAKRRGAFEKILTSLPGAPELRATWSKWGPRIRINLNDFVRGAITRTPTGAIKSLIVAPQKAVRGVLKMYQDGTIGGHISVIPKHILNGVVRGIVEIDELGQLVGNIRLVPGGPLRVVLHFATGAARTDLRDLLVSPLGAMGNLAQAFRQFHFTGVSFNLRLFNQSIFEISSNLRIPYTLIKKRVDDLVQLGILRRNIDGKLTGLFDYLTEDPKLLRYIFTDVKASVLGNIRFSKLSDEAIAGNTYLRMLAASNTRILNRAKLTVEGLQGIATNLRIHGWNIYNIGDILKVTWDQSKELVQNGLWRLRGFAQDWGLKAVDDIAPFWEDRMNSLLKSYRSSSRYRGLSTDEALLRSLEAVDRGAGQVNPIQFRNMMKLLDVQPGDLAGKVENRLKNMLTFIRMNEGLDNDDIRRILDSIGDAQIRRFAQQVTNRTPLKVVNAVAAKFLDETGATRMYNKLETLAWRIMDQAGNSPYGRWLRENGFINPELFIKRGLEELDQAEVYLTMPDGTVRRIIGPFLRIDADNWEKYLDDLTDVDKHLWDDLFNEYNFMAQRYRKLDPPDIFLIESSMGTPYQDGNAIYIPLLHTEIMEGVPSVTSFSPWSENWGRHWIADSIMREQVGEVTGKLNPVFIHEYTHYLAEEMVSTPAGRQAFTGMMGKLDDYFGAPGNYDAYLKSTVYRTPDEIIGHTLENYPSDLWSQEVADDIEEELGFYTDTSMQEFFAEANRHWLTDNNPGPIATIVGQAFDQYYGVTT